MKKFNLLLSLLPLAAIAASALPASAETLHFPYYPSLSPDGKDIYFSYDGDIFRVGADGGTAMRLVSLGGNENYPVVSPDGRLLAFSSDINGNNDVFIVPVGGGEVTRLTWHEANDYPVGPRTRRPSISRATAPTAAPPIPWVWTAALPRSSSRGISTLSAT